MSSRDGGLMEKSFTVQSHGGPYKVSFEVDFSFLDHLRERGGIWIVDRKVYDLYPKLFKVGSLLLLDATEQEKTLTAAANLTKTLVDLGCKRNTPVISVGGGVTQDVTGFVASMLYRGLNWTYIPTTLLAQADSCIGGKTSLNFDSAKNLLGTFYAPKQVYICEAFLKTLSWQDRASGIGEIVKLFLIRSRGLEGVMEVSRLLHNPNILFQLCDSLLIKKEFIEEDEFDNGRRKILNYGHCFGHALEAVSSFSIPHGIAVVAGMLFASIVAAKRGLIDSVMFGVLENVILIPRLHAQSFNYKDSLLNRDGLWEAMGKDKKRAGEGVAIILPRQNEEPKLFQDLSRDEFDRAMDQLF